MRVGVTASVLAHIAVILVAIIGLNTAHALTPDAEASIAVDLVPIEDTTSVRTGSETSKVIDTKTPAVVDSNQPALPDQPTGNTTQAQPKPGQTATAALTPTTSTTTAPQPQPKPEPQPVIPAEPAPQPQPKPQPQPEPEPKPEPKPAPEPKPQPQAAAPVTPLPELAADTRTAADSAPVVPAPVTQTASLEQKRADLKKLQDATAKAAAADAAAKAAADAQAKADAAAKAAAAAAEAEAKADAAKAATAAAAQAAADAQVIAEVQKTAAAAAAQAKADAKKLALAQAQAARAAKVADEIAELTSDDKSTGARTGQGGSAAAGKPTGTAAKLTLSEMAALGAQIKSCWQLLPSEAQSNMTVELMVDFNTDGSVNGTPRVIRADASEEGGQIARAAQRAVIQCAPYKLPSAKYDDWKQVDVELHPDE